MEYIEQFGAYKGGILPIMAEESIMDKNKGPRKLDGSVRKRRLFWLKVFMFVLFIIIIIRLAYIQLA